MTNRYQITLFPNVVGTRYPHKSVSGILANFSNLSDLERVIVKHAWSPAVFQDNCRRNENFKRMSVMGLDFDGNAMIKDVAGKLRILDLEFSITLTRHHQKQKGNKPPCDRFRVVIPLEEPITNQKEFLETWRSIRNEFPQIDAQCKDAARFYFASIHGVWRG
jgi:hypothetical protein